jgi:hypothetical protein
MGAKSKQKSDDDLKPTDVSEELIEEIAASLNIDTTDALDLIMFMYHEIPRE